jgi:hypothetical protein
MNQYNRNEIDNLGVWPEFEGRMHFYVPMDVVSVEFKNCSNEEMQNDENELGSGEQESVWVLAIPITEPHIKYVNGVCFR